MAVPNVEVILWLFLSLMVTYYSVERSLLQQKRIKNVLQTSMLQEKLSALSNMCTENDKLNTSSFDDIIHHFYLSKSRNKVFKILCDGQREAAV